MEGGASRSTSVENRTVRADVSIGGGKDWPPVGMSTPEDDDLW